MSAKRIIEALSEFAGPTFDQWRGHESLPTIDQLSVEQNNRLQRLGSCPTALVVVHPGFVRRQLALDHYYTTMHRDDLTTSQRYSLEISVAMARGELGDWRAHDRTVAKLMHGLAATSVPVVCYVEKGALYHPSLIESDLRPPSEAITIATEKLSSDPAPSVLAQADPGDGPLRLHQQPWRTVQALQQAGVQQVVLAGAFSINPWRGNSGCLGTVASNFDRAGFTVRGVEGAVFPHVLPNRHTEAWLAAALHSQAVPENEVLALAGA
jgi:hypothetical protein